MPNNISIRQFRYPEDYDQVRILWESMETGVEVGRSDSLEEIRKKIQRDPELFLVAEIEGKIIGTAIGGFDGRRGLIYHLAVTADQRNNGVGGRLLDEVEAGLRKRGCLKCYLMIKPDNKTAAAFYKKRGWHYMDYVLPFGKDLQ